MAVWVGSRPDSDGAATGTFRALTELVEQGTDEQPHLTLIAFVDELLARYPDLTEDAARDCPWSIGPLKDEIIGSFLYIPMGYGSVEDVVPFIVDRATAHGLVCFDPQTERLLTPAAAG
jgi:hypothetical protein